MASMPLLSTKDQYTSSLCLNISPIIQNSIRLPKPAQFKKTYWFPATAQHFPYTWLSFAINWYIWLIYMSRNKLSLANGDKQPIKLRSCQGHQRCTRGKRDDSRPTCRICRSFRGLSFEIGMWKARSFYKCPDTNGWGFGNSGSRAYASD